MMNTFSLSLSVSNLHNGIRLVDSEALACITSFCFPSAAASVQCLAWVPSAPGMFITGGNVCVGRVRAPGPLLPRFVSWLDLSFNVQHTSQLVCGPCCCHSAICLCKDAFLVAFPWVHLAPLNPNNTSNLTLHDFQIVNGGHTTLIPKNYNAKMSLCMSFVHAYSIRKQ